MNTASTIRAFLANLITEFQRSRHIVATTFHISPYDEKALDAYLREQGWLKDGVNIRDAFPKVLGLTVKWDHNGNTEVSGE